MIRRPRRNRKKAAHGREKQLRGIETFELQVVDQAGVVQKLCISVPPGFEWTRFCISHTSGFSRRIGDTDDMIGP